MWTKTRGVVAALFVAAFATVGFVGTAVAQDCATTPTAELCSNEVTQSLNDTFMQVISDNVLIVVGLIALAIAIPIVIRLVQSAARKVRA